jgi:hypothetical protein
MKIKILVITVLIALMSACVSRPPVPQWSAYDEAMEAEYIPYLSVGKSVIAGQAFMAQQGGGVVKGAGRLVTLDPATTVGVEWWNKAGKLWMFKAMTPASPGFSKARRTTTSDAEGRFSFQNLPAGKYYVRTEVTWMIGSYNTQGGLVGSLVEVADGATKDIIINAYPN